MKYPFFKNNSETLFFEDYIDFPPLEIKVWETKEDREAGESIEIELFYALSNAKAYAESIWYKNNYACVEVQNEFDTFLHFSGDNQ